MAMTEIGKSAILSALCGEDWWQGNGTAILKTAEGLEVEVRVLNAREVYGRVDVQVTGARPFIPPRKPVTAWEIEPLEENGDEFYVLTFHHGLGKMTHLDLSADELSELVAYLQVAK